MDVENKGSNVLVFPDARSRFSREMLVISACVDSENTAESFNAVQKTELVDSI